MQQFQILLSSLAVVLLLTAQVLLPALDHHLAERIPGHGHVFFANRAPVLVEGQVAPHTHPFTQRHSHRHGDAPEHSYGADLTSEITAANPPTEFVAVSTPQAGLGSAQLVSENLWLAPEVVGPSSDLLGAFYATSSVSPAIPIINPPDRPPIVAS